MQLPIFGNEQLKIKKKISMWWFSFKLALTFYMKKLGLDISALGYFRKWIILGFLIGVVGGVGAIIFTTLLKFFETFFENISPIIIAPVIGGLISGLLVYTFAPEAEGHGTDAVIDAVHRGWAKIRARVPLIKTIASAITIASGGSAGKEGPIAQIAAGLGSIVGSELKLSINDRRILVIAGVAAGIGAIFKAPLGASIFAIEVLYTRDYEVEAMVPAIIASIVAYSIYGTYTGWSPVLTHPIYVFSNPLELIFVIILGIVCGFMSVSYVTVFYGTRDWVFKKLNIKDHFKPALGGLGVGILGLLYPEVMGGGYGVINNILRGKMSNITLLLILVFAKILATSFTISSGGSGGVFAPSLFIGSALGGFLGYIFHSIAPNIVVKPTAYALIGMAAFFSGAAKVPLTSIIIVSEMTGGYTLLPIATMASALSYIISGRKSIYENQILSRIRK